MYIRFPSLSFAILQMYSSCIYFRCITNAKKISPLNLVTCVQIYSEQDTSKMPLELGSALSIEREPVDDPEIRVQALDAIYMITLQVKRVN